jgi:AraC-like DNA-binding protein
MPQYAENARNLSFYRMHFVLQGQGILRVGKSEIHLHEGDIFFCLPAVTYSLESLDGFEYAYVSFLGSRANYLLDRFRINEKNCVFRGFLSLSEAWREALAVDDAVADLKSESVLLQAFAEIGMKYYPSDEKTKERNSAFEIKRFIDNNFSNCELSLTMVASQLNYHPKYISALFKTVFKIGFSNYLNTVRIQNACALIQQGLTEIKNIAFLCGFNDPLYFSKVFKAHLAISPREYVKSQRERK